MRTAIAALALLAASTSQAGIWECKYTAPRNVAAQAAGITRVVITAESGELRVEGHAGATTINASGTACSSDQDFLQKVKLTATKRGNELHVEVDIPEQVEIFGFGEEARLDLTVTLPDNLPVVVRDGSGAATITNVAGADVKDGSGSLSIKGVRGNLAVNDGSGGIEIGDVTGDVTIEDGSGGIDIARVGGTVLIDDDGSGGVEITDVRRNVRIEDKGSGGVHVTNVGGDFIVDRKGSGSIDYARVSGRVSLPRDRD